MVVFAVVYLVAKRKTTMARILRAAELFKVGLKAHNKHEHGGFRGGFNIMLGMFLQKTTMVVTTVNLW